MRVQVPIGEYLRVAEKLSRVAYSKYPDFIEVEGEPVEEKHIKHERCEFCNISPGYVHYKNCPHISSLIEELPQPWSEVRGTSYNYHPSSQEIVDKFNEIIKHLNSTNTHLQ